MRPLLGTPDIRLYVAYWTHIETPSQHVFDLYTPCPLCGRRMRRMPRGSSGLPDILPGTVTQRFLGHMPLEDSGDKHLIHRSRPCRTRLKKRRRGGGPSTQSPTLPLQEFA